MKTSVSVQDVTDSAGSTNSSCSVSSILSASDDVSSQDAGIAISQVESLLAVDAVSLVVNFSARVTTVSNTTVSDLIEHVTSVTLTAVLVTIVSKTTVLADNRGRDA